MVVFRSYIGRAAQQKVASFCWRDEKPTAKLWVSLFSKQKATQQGWASLSRYLSLQPTRQYGVKRYDLYLKMMRARSDESKRLFDSHFIPYGPERAQLCASTRLGEVKGVRSA